jgi:hypothetical protein
MSRHFIEAFGRSRELLAHKFASGAHVVTLPMDGLVRDLCCSGAETILVFEEWTLTLPTLRGEIPVAIAADESVGARTIFSGRRAKSVTFRDGTSAELPVWLMPHDEQRYRAVQAIRHLLAHPEWMGDSRQMLIVNGQREPVFCSWVTSLGSDAVLYCIETHERRYSLAVAASVVESPRLLVEIVADGRIAFANGVTHTVHSRARPMAENLPTDLQALRSRLWQLERRRRTPTGGSVGHVRKAG